jgi:hypothetical protein
MFKKGDYIVILRDPEKDSRFIKHGYCFLQDKDLHHFYTDTDLTGTFCGIHSVKFHHNDKWRYATPEEIAEYDRLGKPFDVMQKEKLLEEARRRYPVGSRVKSLYEDLLDTVKGQYHSNYPDGWKESKRQIWFMGHVYGLLIYDKGKWAEIVSKPEEKGEERFVVGKWYVDRKTWKKPWYIKLSEYTSEKVKGECIDGNSMYIEKDWWNSGIMIKNLEPLTDLSEIQQYLPEGHPDKIPVSKELTSLPEKWCIKPTSSSVTAISKYFHSIGNAYVGYESSWKVSCHGSPVNYFHFPQYKPRAWGEVEVREGYTEITFDQFKKWVLKESPEISLEGRYLKCISDLGKSHYPCKKGDYLKFSVIKDNCQHWGAYDSKGLRTGTEDSPRYWGIDVHLNPDFELMPEGFVPPESKPELTEKVEKGDAGTYVVYLKDLDHSFRKKGVVEMIVSKSNHPERCVKMEESASLALADRETEGDVKWFATKSEAEEFAKTLMEPVEDYQNVLDIEVGDTVRCISENKSKFGTKGSAGGGWKKDYEFVVDRITDTYSHKPGGKVYWEKGSGGGVYSDAVRLVKKKDKPEPVKAPAEPEWTPQVGEWVKCIGDSNFTSNHTSSGWEKDLVFKVTKIEITLDKLIAFGGKHGNGVWVFESNLRKALPHEIPFEHRPGITAQIESAKDYGVLTAEKLKGIVSDLFLDPVKSETLTPQYIKCKSNGYSYRTHHAARQYGAENYAHGELPVDGKVYKVIRRVEINPGQFGYSCTLNGKDYLIGEEGVTIATYEEFCLQQSGNPCIIQDVWPYDELVEYPLPEELLERVNLQIVKLTSSKPEVSVPVISFLSPLR